MININKVEKKLPLNISIKKRDSTSTKIDNEKTDKSVKIENNKHNSMSSSISNGILIYND